MEHILTNPYGTWANQDRSLSLPREYRGLLNAKDPSLLSDLHISRETLHPLCERSRLPGSLPLTLPQVLATLSAPWRLLSCRLRFPGFCGVGTEDRSNVSFLLQQRTGNVVGPPSFLLQVANEVSSLDVPLFLPREQGDSFIFSLCPLSPVCPGRFLRIAEPFAFPDTTLRNHDHDSNNHVCFLLCSPQSKKTSLFPFAF